MLEIYHTKTKLKAHGAGSISILFFDVSPRFSIWAIVEAECMSLELTNKMLPTFVRYTLL